MDGPTCLEPVPGEQPPAPAAVHPSPKGPGGLLDPSGRTLPRAPRPCPPEVPASTGEDWFSVRDASRYLGIHQRTLYSLIDKGDVPAYKFGRVIRLRRHEVEAFLERQRVAPGSLRHVLDKST